MDTAAQIVVGIGTTAVLHPISYAKVLIQLGHEPFPPKASTNIFGHKVLMYPNILKYISHIKERDGFFGLYRGLFFRLVCNVVNNCASTHVYAALTEPCADQAVTVPPTEQEDSAAKLFKCTLNEVISHSAGIVISHPFHVIFVRSVAQFIGGEEQYSSMIPSFFELWRSDGIQGFFAGLVPRLLGEVLTICLCNVVTFLINNFIFEKKSDPDQTNKELRGYSGTISNLIVSQMTYPFTVVANMMAVSGCSGLAVGRANNYSSWIVCWASLASQNELKRGSSMFWRQYRGHLIVSRNGSVRPSP